MYLLREYLGLIWGLGFWVSGAPFLYELAMVKGLIA